MSQFTVSSSETSSLCTSQAPHPSMREGTANPESVVVSFSKRTSTRQSAGAALGSGFDEKAAASPKSARTPKVLSQSGKAAAAKAAQESPSMTIRRLPLDYSKRLEEQRARSNAMERYKILVRGNQSVKCGQPSPNPALVRGEKELSTRRGGAHCPALPTHQDCSATTEAVLSDESEARQQEPPLPVARSPQGVRGPAPPSSSQQPQKCATPLSSPVSVSVSVDRPVAHPQGSAAANVEGGFSGDPAVPAGMQLDLTKALALQFPAAAHCGTGEDEAACVHYVAPELTQPYPTSRQPRRETVRPGYEPVTAHDCTSFKRTLSASAQGDQSPYTSASQLQSRSKMRRGSSATSHLASVAAGAPPLSNQSTPSRKRSLVGTAPALSATTSASLPKNPNVSVSEEAAAATAISTRHPPTLGGVATQLFPADREDDVQQRVGAERDGSESHGALMAEAASQSEQEAMPLAGSKTAFWLRPSTAMYEMTASIAAKRKVHHVDEEDTQSTSNRRNQILSRPFTSNMSTSSSCCTPRGRVSTVSEAKPRFTTSMTAADRARYEGIQATAASARAPTYDSIYSARRPTSHKSASARLQRRVLTDASTVSRSLDSPRLASQQPLQRLASRVEGPRSPLGRRPSIVSGLNSDPLLTASSEERHGAGDAGRVLIRQQDSFSKHCTRVATRNSRPEEPASTAARSAKPSKKRAVAASAAGLSAKLEAHSRVSSEADAEPRLHTTLAHTADRASTSSVEPRPEPPSPESTLHGRRGSSEASPSKSRRCELDITASPSRPDKPSDLESRLAAQDAAVGREEEEARVQQKQATLESCRQARQVRMEGRRASHTGGAVTASTNEVVAAMLQGIVQQTRQALPCYMCADEQTASAYRVHVDMCRPKAEALLHEYYTATKDTKAIPAALQERIQHMALQEVPSTTSPEAARDAFTMECYQCLKAMLVACRKCSVHVRVQDLKEHEMLCDRAYYQSSRAAERVRATVQRIQNAAE
ncbi:hypothetical protein JKF63_02625 [Porcisia hertigi]|uniref:Uncharacterized protein n=1 Tax=Porcisia hertigi TaxID=2761500 RepID=A0A836I9U6_9TRYP|nr:hypothetical protein JKF63_02625 [Porcisia hertigi]